MSVQHQYMDDCFFIFNQLLKVTISLTCTIYAWSITAFCALLSFVVIILSKIFKDIDDSRVKELQETIFGQLLYYLGKPIWSLEIFNDINNMDPINIKFRKEQYIICPNHQSFIDSMVTCFIPLKKKYVVGSGFYNMIIFGDMCKLAGDIPINREAKDVMKNLLYNSKIAINDRNSILIYPEGRRSRYAPRTDKMGNGAFEIAKKTDKKILLVRIEGTSNIIHFGPWVFPGKIRMTYGPCISIINNGKKFVVDTIVKDCGDNYSNVKEYMKNFYEHGLPQD